VIFRLIYEPNRLTNNNLPDDVLANNEGDRYDVISILNADVIVGDNVIIGDDVLVRDIL
jgi:acetyltransferase-like isoleucine patch superfamily enzyme